MAATELLASGTTQANATEVTLTAGTPVTVTIHYTGRSDGVAYAVYHKNAAGSAYQFLFTLTPANNVEKGTFSGSGTYRFTRQASANASSLEMD